MGLRIVARVDRAHPVLIELQAAHQVGDVALAFHQAAAARLHFSHKATTLFTHQIGTPVQGAKIAGLDPLTQLGVLHRSPEAPVIGQGLVMDDQAVSVPLRAQHSDAIGGCRVDGVALFEQQGTGLQLGEGPQLHQDVGVERRIFKGLLLVAEAPAQEAHQPAQGCVHDGDLMEKRTSGRFLDHAPQPL